MPHETNKPKPIEQLKALLKSSKSKEESALIIKKRIAAVSQVGFRPERSL